MEINVMAIPGIVPDFTYIGLDHVINKIRIAEIVTKHYGIKPHTLRLKSREQPIPECRYVVMLVCYALNIYRNYKSLTSDFNLDHSTMSHGINVTLRNLYATSKEFRNKLELIMNDLSLNDQQKKDVVNMLKEN